MQRNELPIVTAPYRMVQDLIPAVDRMPRGLRSLVGSELVRDVVALQTCLHEAALHRGRRSALEQADVHLTRIRVLLRLVFDQRALSVSMYETSQKRAEEVGKMLGGWLRSEGRPRSSSDRGSVRPSSEGACLP